MPIVSSDIQYRLSVTSGAAGNSAAQANPNASLGRYVSTTQLGAGLNSLFDDITGAENNSDTVDYRCIFVLNNHASLTLLNASVYLSAQVPDGASIAIAVDNIAASAKGASGAQAAVISNELVAPVGVGAFSSPSSLGTALALGDIGPGQVKAFWVQRSATHSIAVSNDGVTFAIAGDTAP